MLKIEFNPSGKHIADIENWLIDEWNKSNNGFYCNWNIISDQFAEKNVGVITEDDYAIGFLVYRIYEFYAIIDISEVKPSERNKGVAKKLINETLEFFRNKGVLVVELYCSPENSESFWKRIGFENFPNLPHETKLNMFKPLVETLIPTENTKTDNTISLWNCEPYLANTVKAKWIWDLDFTIDEETLSRPIIFPVSYDWQVELKICGQTILSNKVKRFPVDLADCGRFMIVRKIRVNN